MPTLKYELPKRKIGTKFIYRPHKVAQHEATIIGYQIIHETDTGYTNMTYHISYDYLGQTMKTSVPRSTVERTLLQKERQRPAREAAKQLIAKYVERGDTLEYLASGSMGAAHPNGMSVHIGGYMDDKSYSNHTICVERDINGNEVNKAFKLEDIYNELKSGQGGVRDMIAKAKKAPLVLWRHERMFTKELYFFRRKVYCTVHIGFVRGRRKPLGHRQPSRRQQRPLLARLIM